MLDTTLVLTATLHNQEAILIYSLNKPNAALVTFMLLPRGDNFHKHLGRHPNALRISILIKVAYMKER